MSPAPRRRWRPARAAIAAAVFVAAAAAIAIGEWQGWPGLAPHAQRWLSGALAREVRIAGADGTPASFRIRFIGGIRLQASAIDVAAPAWSQAPHLVAARDVTLELRYVDLWRARRGQPLRVHRLQAAALDATLERRADGRASWQFGDAPPPGVASASLPSFGSLQLATGRVRFRDERLAADVEAMLSLTDRVASVEEASDAAAAAPPTSVLQVTADGRYRGLPLKAQLQSSGVMPWSADEASTSVPVPVTLDLSVGRASLAFEGRAEDVASLRGLVGRYTLKGPSLAAVGDPLGLTLPTTAAFRSAGALVKEGDTWRVAVDEFAVGASRLDGAFSYEVGRATPLLAGRLGGRRLLLADLGPAIGTTPAVAAASVNVPAGEVQPQVLPAATRGRGKVLPNRPFDLAALRTMDANVLIDIAEVDLDTRALEPLRPLHAHLQLRGGVLTLNDLRARTGEGQVMGTLQLDGRGAEAVWNADLGWRGIRLERWIRQDVVSGALSGRATGEGRGRSTAEILASLKGQLRGQIRDGTVSHVAIEAIGLDVAQGLGVTLRGDDALKVQCAVADVAVERGVFKPRVMVLDTKDSVVWIDGAASLATEALDLRAVVTPKDFSPLALRTPLRLQGSLAAPAVVAEPGPLGVKAAAAVALAFLHPLAAAIPFIDPGDPEEAGSVAEQCRNLAQRGAARP